LLYQLKRRAHGNKFYGDLKQSGVRYGKGILGKIRKSGFEMVAFGILAMLLFLRVENHYAH
jgi:hypothetical protein